MPTVVWTRMARPEQQGGQARDGRPRCPGSRRARVARTAAPAPRSKPAPGLVIGETTGGPGRTPAGSNPRPGEGDGLLQGTGGWLTAATRPDRDVLGEPLELSPLVTIDVADLAASAPWLVVSTVDPQGVSRPAPWATAVSPVRQADPDAEGGVGEQQRPWPCGADRQRSLPTSPPPATTGMPTATPLSVPRSTGHRCSRSWRTPLSITSAATVGIWPTKAGAAGRSSSCSSPLGGRGLDLLAAWSAGQLVAQPLRSPLAAIAVVEGAGEEVADRARTLWVAVAGRGRTASWALPRTSLESRRCRCCGRRW